ncbi:MAG TPA: MATE family efflux transporter [Puia sp.]|jgi:putative MATE family efflux protein|nr:MATE family efflux transporter [Puia sp.]
MSTATNIANNYKVDISNRQILKMMLPISFAILVPQLNFITNNIFLGHLNEESLAIAGITGVYYLIFAVIGNGLNNGLQVLIARRSGEGRLEEIGKLFSQSIRISFVCAAVGILLTYFIAPAILKFSIHSDVIREQAIHFLKIRIWGLPFLYVYQMRNALLVGTNQSKYLIYGAIAEAVMNVFFDYSLIFGHFGLPQMGFDGAAVSSIIAEIAGLVVIFAVINAKGISKKLQLFKHIGFDAKNTKLIIVQSSPLVLQFAISIITWEFFYILIEHHGEQALAISNTMRNIFGIFGAFIWAFAATTSSMASNIIGQGKKERVIELINKIARLSFSLTLVYVILLNLFPQILLSIYGQNESFVIAAIPVVRVISVAMLIMSFATIWLNGVTGTGNTTVNLAIEIFTLIFYIIYVYFILEYYKLSIIYGWMSEWLYWICIFVPAYFYIKSGRWKKKVL